MAASTNIHFTVAGIGNVLAEKNLIVPPYQRSYAWESKHVTELFTDLGTSIGEKRDEYFLGSIVLLEEGSKFQVVDGQQRLATSTILICAIRDYFQENRDEDRASGVERDYLMSKDRRTQEYQSNLILNRVDHDFFLNYILKFKQQNERKKVKIVHESHKRIKKAADLARSYVKNLVGVTNNPTQHLIDWLDYLDKQSKVIRVQVPDGANAFTIFETLNDRGLDLAISDLLKNFLFKQAEDRIGEAQEAWAQMTGSLAAVDAEKHIVSYIRHIWSTQQGLIRERELYQSIKDKVNSKQTAIDTSKLLADGARLYSAILSPNHEMWRKYGESARRHMEILNLLRMTQVRPLILAVLKYFKDKDVASSMRLLVSFSVRFYILGRLGSGDLETFYAGKAQEIASGKIKSFKELRETSRREVPTNSQFENAFNTATVGKSYLARYYLFALENKRQVSELVVNDNPEQVDLEHVLPENPSEGWKINEHFYETHINRIGNLCLLLKNENSLMGNETFDKKKSVYSKSKLELTKEITEFSTWDQSAIDKRQARLAKLAVKTWAI